ncbi:FadR/GntR family transcriptional regulator [Streptomyces sp. SudanB182_2057]|uniref:FadR/GntR family transcriptional regulator n=1 Tax=Streptomyces sp. SudanB182_2057 TaxID=3035281 RepID=UPI003F564FCA
MALTDEAIAKIRSLIQSGELSPGARLPPEPRLATQMGLSRSGVREAVKDLESARVPRTSCSPSTRPSTTPCAPATSCSHRPAP